MHDHPNTACRKKKRCCLEAADWALLCCSDVELRAHEAQTVGSEPARDLDNDETRHDRDDIRKLLDDGDRQCQRGRKFDKM